MGSVERGVDESPVGSSCAPSRLPEVTSKMPPAPMSWYEQQQVEKIAGWKAEPPAYLSTILAKVTHPLVNLTEHLVRRETVIESIRDAYASSEVSAHRER